MSLPNLSLEGRIALVTGGSRGIGREIALTFAQAGADVAICARNLPPLEKIADEVVALGRRSLAIQADTGVKADVEAMVGRIVREFGALDILVNNAGLGISGPLLEFSEDDWDKLMNVNLKGYFLCAQAAGRVMVERKKGSIVNISSINAVQTTSATGELGLGAYSISKAGVAMLTKALVAELGPYNVRVNALGPGAVRTELVETMPHWKVPGAMERALGRIPLGRLPETSDVAHTALFLASDASSYLTGQMIFVDGGRLVAS